MAERNGSAGAQAGPSEDGNASPVAASDEPCEAIEQALHFSVDTAPQSMLAAVSASRKLSAAFQDAELFVPVGVGDLDVCKSNASSSRLSRGCSVAPGLRGRDGAVGGARQGGRRGNGPTSCSIACCERPFLFLNEITLLWW